MDILFKHRLSVSRSDFNIIDTIYSGQVFRVQQPYKGIYSIITTDKRIFMRQDDEGIDLSCDEKEYDNYWYKYLGMDVDYAILKKTLIEKEMTIEPMINYRQGLHILWQDPWEMLVTFILSTNNNIPRIKSCVETLADAYGEYVHSEYGDYQAFPTAHNMRAATVEELRFLGLGYRAKYIYKLVQDVLNNRWTLPREGQYPRTLDLTAKLMEVDGVGRKVADCVALFAYNKTDVFPVDVWIRRAVAEMKMCNIGTDDKITKEALVLWGALAGYAQQYIYEYARNKQAT